MDTGKLLAQNTSQMDEIKNQISNDANAWVNTPRRAMKWHKQIKEALLVGSKIPKRIEIEGGEWGLACNSIHFIDLISWWYDTNVVNVETSELGSWGKSKRPGFCEVSGTLKIHFKNGINLEMTSNSSNEDLNIKIHTLDGEWNINEVKSAAKDQIK